jgi:hypothetical protein
VERKCSGKFADVRGCLRGILSLPKIADQARLHTGGYGMGLSRYKVAAGLAVSDMDRARAFYEGKLGLSVGIDSGTTSSTGAPRGP